jgi:hypothetical protein
LLPFSTGLLVLLWHAPAPAVAAALAAAAAAAAIVVLERRGGGRLSSSSVVALAAASVAAAAVLPLLYCTPPLWSLNCPLCNCALCNGPPTAVAGGGGGGEVDASSVDVEPAALVLAVVTAAPVQMLPSKLLVQQLDCTYASRALTSERAAMRSRTVCYHANSSSNTRAVPVAGVSACRELLAALLYCCVGHYNACSSQQCSSIATVNTLCSAMCSYLPLCGPMLPALQPNAVALPSVLFSLSLSALS